MSVAPTGNTLTLSALDPDTGLPGQWTNFPISYTYKWHTVSAPLTSLGTGSTLAINISTTPAIVGQAIELDVTAANLAGSTTVTSHWFGPIEATAPIPPSQTTGLCSGGAYCIPELERALPPALGSGTLPTELIHFLQNGHAIFPGCDIPPVKQNTAAGHVWYFDPVNGTTKDAGATGADKAHAFKDVAAIFNATAGYTGSPLFGVGKTIPPGDTIYIEPGDASHPVSAITAASGTANSTSDGTPTGTVAFTWIMGDPTASRPVLTSVSLGSGIGFVFKNFNNEQYRGSPMINVGGNVSFPSFDINFEGIHSSEWLGHSEDPWPGSYPTSGGTSDGTIVSASAVTAEDSGLQDAPNITLTAATAVHATTIAISALPQMNWYVWSPNYYYISGVPVVPLTANGIPSGSMVKQINGLDDAHYTYGNWNVNAIRASDLTALPLGGTVATVGGLPASNDGNYWLVQTSTLVLSVYTWNGSAWASIGTIPPASPPDSQAVYWATTTGHVGHWNGSSWDDLGTPNLTLGPCDPVTDAATGCPPANSYPLLTGSGNNNVPGCDPLLSAIITAVKSGGCPPGVPPIWQGTTRAIASGEKISLTSKLAILPSGYWNSVDWDGGVAIMFHFTGTEGTAIDPSNPNLLLGNKCMSVKDSTARNFAIGMNLARVTNTVLYNNKLKYSSVDYFEWYTTHRIWAIHNLTSDPTLIWGHQDGIQLGTTNGQLATKYFYGNGAIENEFYSTMDPTNYFPRTMQGITTTENAHWGMYVCCNIVMGTTNGIGISGKYDAVIHNVEFPLSIAVGNQPKGRPANTDEPTYSLLANNIASGISRQAATNIMSPTPICPPTTGDHVTEAGNVSVPNVTDSAVGAILSSIYCDLNSAQQFGGASGAFQGISIWNATDWRSAVGGVVALFKDYHPVAAPVAPAPGYIEGLAGPYNLCANGTFPPIGSCTAGAFGTIDFRPNASFTGFTGTIGLNVTFAQSLPNGQSNGTLAVVSTATAPNGPAGVWSACSSCTIVVNGSTIHWQFVQAAYNPPIIGAGTSLGAQAPIADLNGKAWGSPPSAGAFQ